MSDKYILKGHIPIPEDDVLKWGKWFKTADRTVKKTNMGSVVISTVFLGLNHNYSFGERPPLLFETMIFGGKHDEDQDRCSTWEQAEKMHEAMVKKVKAD